MHERMDLGMVETMSFMLISFSKIPGSGLFKTLIDKGCKHRRLIAMRALTLGSGMMEVT